MTRPLATTRKPSLGVNRVIRSAERNITPRTCAPESLSEKYMWPVFHTLQLDSSPSTQTSKKRSSSVARICALSSDTV